MKFTIMRRKKVLRTISLIWLIGIVSSCGTYYQLNKVNYNFEKRVISEINDHNSVIFIHVKKELYQIKGAAMNGNTIEGFITPVDQVEMNFYKKIQSIYNQKMYLKKEAVIAARQKQAEERTLQIDTIQMNDQNELTQTDISDVLIYQVHLFADNIKVTDNFVQLDLTHIFDMEIFKKSTNIGAVLAIIVVGALLLFLVFIIILIISCNCPHVYLENGTSFEYTNTLFTGAVSKQLERFDYKQIPDFNSKLTTLNMQIRNEDKEIQYTNLIELIAAYHDPSFDVLMDQRGQLHSISSPKQATLSKDQNGTNLSNVLNSLDGDNYKFDTPSKKGISTAYLSFENQKENAKLVLGLKNSDWAGLIHQEFNAALGSKKDKWLAKNHQKSSSELLQQMKKAGIPLVVSVKKNNKWIELETIQPIGNTGIQSLVIPIDSNLLSDESIEIRIDGGFMFWELDYAHIDFSAPKSIAIQTISPTAASGNGEFLAALQKDDKNYMTTTIGSDAVSVQFNGLKPNNRTLFVRSKGYYVRQESSTKSPQWVELAKLKRSHGLARFSQDVFLRYLNEFNQLSLK